MTEFTENQIEALTDIISNDTDRVRSDQDIAGFISNAQLTLETIASMYTYQQSDQYHRPQKKPSQIQNELNQFCQKIEELSPEAQTFISREYLLEGHGKRVLFNLVNVLRTKKFKKVRGDWCRDALGWQALMNFSHFNLPISSSRSGVFVEYLSILIKAVGLIYDPVKLAIKVIETNKI